MARPTLTATAISGIPIIEPGCDLATAIAAAAENNGLEACDGDVFAIAQKIVSKAEGRIVELDSVEPGAVATELAEKADKDPRIVELILRESRRVVRHRPGAIITEHRLGIILANAGIDRSNVRGGADAALLLPVDPDDSARRLRQDLESRWGVRLGIVITDSIGRPWRLGTIGVAIGCAGVPVLEDLRGQPDLFGRPLEVSEVATADAIAATANLVSGESNEASPVILVRGIDAGADGPGARALLRPADEDLFRD